MRKKILLMVEDDAVDAMVIKRALQELNVNFELRWVKNGLEGLELLKQGSDEFCLILLDLNMPVMNGFEFLEAKRNLENLKGIRTVILTTSNVSSDRDKSMELGAHGYLVKPLGYEEFKHSLAEIDFTPCND